MNIIWQEGNQRKGRRKPKGQPQGIKKAALNERNPKRINVVSLSIGFWLWRLTYAMNHHVKKENRWFKQIKLKPSYLKRQIKRVSYTWRIFIFRCIFLKGSSTYYPAQFYPYRSAILSPDSIGFSLTSFLLYKAFVSSDIYNGTGSLLCLLPVKDTTDSVAGSSRFLTPVLTQISNLFSNHSTFRSLHNTCYTTHFILNHLYLNYLIIQIILNYPLCKSLIVEHFLVNPLHSLIWDTFDEIRVFYHHFGCFRFLGNLRHL